MKTSVITITPEQATTWLNKSKHNNRPISRASVSKISRALKNGEWALNGQPIIISDEDDLIDGQHRLLACKETGIPITSLIVEGVPASTYSTMDNGRLRSLSDTLSGLGYTNTLKLSSALRLLIWYEDNDGTKFNAGKYSNRMGEDRIAGFSDLDVCVRMGDIKQLRMLGSVGAFIFVVYHARSYDPKMATDFFGMLASGLGLLEGSPIAALRNRLIRAKGDDLRMSPVRVAAMTVIAWNAVVEGRNMQIVRWKETSAFPVIVGTRE